VIYLDAGALLALLLDEPAAPDVEHMLRAGDVAITSVNYAEVTDQATRVQKRGHTQLARAIDPLVTGDVLRITAVSREMGQRAGELRARHYDRETRPVCWATAFSSEQQTSSGLMWRRPTKSSPTLREPPGLSCAPCPTVTGRSTHNHLISGSGSPPSLA
jgi:uncharacterized protein with PIN domain